MRNPVLFLWIPAGVYLDVNRGRNDDVTDPIEEQVNTIEGVKHITSASGYGFSQVVVEFELYRNIDSAVQDVRAKVDLAKREIRVWLDGKRLEAHRLTSNDVARAFLTKNVELPGGIIESIDREFTVRNLGELRNIEEFNNLIILYQNGAPIRLKDVGWTEDGRGHVRQIG